MPIKKIKDFLDSHGVRYVSLKHSPAYTAQEVAANAHICGHNLAKTVIVKIDGSIAMVVLPASKHINFDLLCEMTGTDDVRLASEIEIENLFPGCESGAIPAFGNLYEMEVYIAPSLTGERWITFSAGTHSELIRMSWSDFENLVRPSVVSLAC